ncbi:MAG: ACT domain-containing protein [Acidobacteriota bacterium]
MSDEAQGKEPLRLTTLVDRFAVVRFLPSATLPEFEDGSFFSFTRTEEEVSVICREENAGAGGDIEGGWRCLKVGGPLPFTMTGVLASIAVPLAHAAIPIFVVSTYDTDYVFMKDEKLDGARTVLAAAGFVVDG